MTKKKITDFVPQVKNPNLHNTFGMRLLEESIQNDGWIGAQTSAKDGEIIAGSARQLIAVEKFIDADGKEVEPIVIESDGSRPVVIVRTDIANANTARARRLSAAENQIAKSNYNPDFEILKAWSGEDEQIKKMFSDDEWREGTGEEPVTVDAEPQLDRAAELLKKWKVKTGDLWQIGEHRLICGDCTDAAVVARVMDGGGAVCMWTDPPYGVEYVGKTKDALTFENDGADNLPKLLEGAYSSADAFLSDGAPVYVAHPPGALQFVFGKAFLDVGWKFHEELVWVKDSMVLGHSDYHLKHEGIHYGWKGSNRFWYSGRAEVSTLDFDRPRRSSDHPTMKPVELVQKCLNNSTQNNDIVLEPFSGSGTTLVACQNLSRRGRAIEISPAYVAVTLERMATAFPHLEIKRLND